jgi:hypothetical protein
MSKTFFQDMIKLKEDLRKEVPNKNLLKKPSVVKQASQAPQAQPTPTPTITKEEKSWTPPVMENKVSRRVEFDTPLTGVDNVGRSRYGLWVVAGVAVIFLFFAVSFMFSKALITINPKISDIPYNQNLQAVKDTDEDTLSFDLVVLSGEEKKTLRGGEVTDLAVKARGTVVIYNNFNTVPQKLAIDTRLEGSNGKIYKTEKALTVPGMKGATPGSIEVNIYGSEAGEAYNSGPLDFTILGFKGTSKYTKFYARSKGDITGGFVGKGSMVSEGSKTNAINELTEILKSKLSKKATEQIPPGFILFPDASFLSVDSEEVGKTEAGSTDVPITIKGTLYGFLFNEEELAKKIVSTAVANGDGSEVFISNIRDLTFALLRRDSSSAGVANINFSLTGTPKVVWKFDADALAAELVDKKKSDFSQILSQYPNIDSADLILRPFWKRSFPSELKNISVTVKYPAQ